VVAERRDPAPGQHLNVGSALGRAAAAALRARIVAALPNPLRCVREGDSTLFVPSLSSPMAVRLSRVRAVNTCYHDLIGSRDRKPIDRPLQQKPIVCLSRRSAVLPTLILRSVAGRAAHRGWGVRGAAAGGGRDAADGGPDTGALVGAPRRRPGADACARLPLLPPSGALHAPRKKMPSCAGNPCLQQGRCLVRPLNSMLNMSKYASLLLR